MPYVKKFKVFRCRFVLSDSTRSDQYSSWEEPLEAPTREAAIELATCFMRDPSTTAIKIVPFQEIVQSP